MKNAAPIEKQMLLNIGVPLKNGGKFHNPLKNQQMRLNGIVCYGDDAASDITDTYAKSVPLNQNV